jgi:GTP1/Obg family GTP-binding protein
MFDESEYSAESIAELDKILSDFINAAIEPSQIQIALGEAKAAMDAVLTLKDEAVAELEAYRATFDESEYSAEAVAELDKILSDFINAAIEPSQIQIALGEAKATMDAVLSE